MADLTDNQRGVGRDTRFATDARRLVDDEDGFVAPWFGSGVCGLGCDVFVGRRLRLSDKALGGHLGAFSSSCQCGIASFAAMV